MRRLTELADAGVLGRAAQRHYSLMGFLDPTVLIQQTAPELVTQMRAERVDAAALVPA